MPNSVADHHPELMHYTTATGLAGIVTSGCLWATHAAFLNDSQEIHHFIDGPLKDVLVEIVGRFCTDLAAKTEQFPISPQDFAHAIVPGLAAYYLEGWRAAIIKNLDFFVFSMSRHSDIAAAHGLLSQWRGYGHDGGYAIVFDTQDLDKLLQKEKFNLCSISMMDVIYDSTAVRNTRAMVTLVTETEKMLGGASADELIQLGEAITTLPAQCKHWGFKEECEVRIVAQLSKPDITNNYAEENDDKRRLKVPKTFIRSGMPVPYLELFSDRPDGSRHLPIKRVIVGPHRDQALRIDAVRRLLAANGYADVAVHGSEISYLGS